MSAGVWGMADLLGEREGHLDVPTVPPRNPKRVHEVDAVLEVPLMQLALRTRLAPATLVVLGEGEGVCFVSWSSNQDYKNSNICTRKQV